MCGIAGFISLNNTITRQQLQLATGVIEKRGPDAEGFYFSDDEKTGLGHRRLSILDLSETANQPMFSHSRRYVMVYNGEVYNYKELQQMLADKGASLNTSSDTEVVLELFAEKGTEIFRYMNGMFALAIYDVEKKILTLARDHAGIKPLFIYADDRELIFASELKAIKAIKQQDLAINKNAIPYFLHLGYIPHPFTIFKNTEKFPAAHVAQINIDTYKATSINNYAKSFWNVESIIKKDPVQHENIAKQKLTELLFDSVQKQLVSDVPIGTFLSGGIDSSLVTAVACKVSNTKINSFSIAIDDGRYNESKYAAQVAQHLQTNHHEFLVKEKEVVELIDTLLPLYDEPFADSSALPTMMVSRLAKKHVTVALSGDGGDELFMGYGMYRWAKRLSKDYSAFVRRPVVAASRLMNDKYRRAGNLFNYSNNANIKSHIFSQEQYFFSEMEIKKILLHQHFDFTELNTLSAPDRKLKKEEEQSFWDFNYYLPDDLLVKVDRASMHYSLETRVPLIDYRIIEFAYNLDSSLKQKNITSKYILKQILYDHVPQQIFDRPKQGFSIPLSKLLKTDLHYLLVKYTSQQIIEKYSLLDYAEVKKLKNYFMKGYDHLFNRLWVIIILHWWLEKYTTEYE